MLVASQNPCSSTCLRGDAKEERRYGDPCELQNDKNSHAQSKCCEFKILRKSGGESSSPKTLIITTA